METDHMFATDFSQLLLFIGLLICSIPLLGTYMAKVYEGRLSSVFESLTYRVAGIDAHEKMSAWRYAKALLWFNALGFIFLLLLQLMQATLPLNPQAFPNTSFALAFNTAASFVTNTNWQSYAGETTLSYLTQMLGLAVQNFLSAATGMAVLVALIRGIVAKNQVHIGNFWVDLVRSVLYILLPMSLVFACVLVSQGVVQSFSPYQEVITLEGRNQTIPLGPAASQVAIKQLGTNGGGFFNANSAHPFENPTGFSNFLETLAILLIPAASVYMYGIMARTKRHAWLLVLVMFVLWSVGLAVSSYSEHIVNPVYGIDSILEGKETRFGVQNSLIWSVSTSATSNGSVNTMMSSLTPLAGGIAMCNIMLGELIFGGDGVGLCSIIMFVLLTVFLSGLMVGRTPEYLGKKIEKREMQWVTVSILAPGALILIGAGISSVLPVALSSITHAGPHGLSEILYAFTSCAGNNGSAFAGLNANTPYYNIVLGVVMICSRLVIVIPSLAIAGLLAKKKQTPPSAGTFSTEGILFAVLLVSVICVVGALTFFPVITLGPLLEHFLMLRGVLL